MKTTAGKADRMKLIWSLCVSVKAGNRHFDIHDSEAGIMAGEFIGLSLGLLAGCQTCAMFRRFNT
jgi:hypothetical protein